jgi:hypothetical protein
VWIPGDQGPPKVNITSQGGHFVSPGGNPYKISDNYPIQGINVNPQSRIIYTPHGHEYSPPCFWNQLPYDVTTGQLLQIFHFSHHHSSPSPPCARSSKANLSDSQPRYQVRVKVIPDYPT